MLSTGRVIVRTPFSMVMATGPASGVMSLSRMQGLPDAWPCRLGRPYDAGVERAADGHPGRPCIALAPRAAAPDPPDAARVVSRLPGRAPDHRAILKGPAAQDGEWPVRSRQARHPAAIWPSGAEPRSAGPILAMLSEVTSRMLVLGIPVERIRTFGDAWSDGGLWDDILWLADGVWKATEDDERRMRWHHLVMAIGNFKRQNGRRLRPARIAPTRATATAARPDRFCVPEGLELICHDAGSWKRLEQSLGGAAAATTTTILAALWPDKSSRPRLEGPCGRHRVGHSRWRRREPGPG